MKGVTEYNIAMFMGFMIALVLLLLMLGWVKNSGEKQQRERNAILAAAGCLEKDACVSQATNKACVHTLEGTNECGCRSWFGIENNADCSTGQRCISAAGTNYGACT